MSYIDIDVEENGIDSVDDREFFKAHDDAYQIQSDDQDLNGNDYGGDTDDLVTIIGVKLRGRGKTDVYKRQVRRLAKRFAVFCSI